MLILWLLPACSTTKRLGPGETLYTGVKKFELNTPKGEKLPGEMVADLKKTINVPPNDPLPFKLNSPFWRSPLPVGLWIYNAYNDSVKGLKGWIYRKFASTPVLISDVRPEVRVKMLEDILDNNGYFGSRVSYSLQEKKNDPKQAKINYILDIGKPYPIDSIIYLSNDTSALSHFVDSLARRSKYLVPGEVFCVDSLIAERVRIANRLRNRGYYYFRPEYIEFLADSTITPKKITLKLTLADNIPPAALLQYRVGNIYTTVERQSKRRPGVPDTIHTQRGELIVMRPARLRDNLVPSCITFRRGKLFSVRDMDRTQTRLSRLGIFSAIDVQPVPAPGDSLTKGSGNLLDVYITCRFDRPLEASIEVNATSKSNSYLGPGLILGLTHHNLFGGAEKLNIQFNADYEWQTGHDRSSVFNSYEFGLTATLAFPRLLAPRFVPRSKRELNWTNISLNASILNRPHYFKIAQFNASYGYEWRSFRHVLNQLTLFKLSYTKLMHTTPEFDSLMNQNPAIALSFQNQFVPQMSYTYTLDKFLEREQMNGINLTASITEAGNIFSGIWRACGVKGEKRLFGTPFSQFIKGQVQLVYSRRLFRGKNQWLVSRVLIGAEHAYGNSSQVPYTEQFYIGGANSIRAFTVRSLGPGSYRAPRKQVNGYFDQTGTFKFELNTEYRFPIVSILHGAAFIDAGNIWLLKDDPMRPGGKLKASSFLRDLALGTGVGLRVDIGVLVIRGDLGYGLHAPYDTGNTGYFNIRFKDAFAFHLAIGYPF